jgi:phenylpropionate dioxygenase-like ring-hydroxylating dioxygenase large terminal subunit
MKIMAADFEPDQTTAPQAPADATGFPEPTHPPHHLEGPSVHVQEVLRHDPIRPPQTLLEPSDYVPPARPIEASRYYSPEFHEREVEKMWCRVWQYAGWTYDIPNPGDIIVYRNVGQSVIVVRQRDGSLKAFRNSCLHRGRELCGADTSQVQLRCPYHAFTWSLDGTSKWIPAAWDFPQIDRAKFSLPEVRVDQWNGFIFINLDDTAPPLANYLGKMTKQWEDWDFNKRFRAVTVVKEINCNWKTALDAFIETLHVYATHPEAAPLTPDTDSQYDVYKDEPHFSRFHSIVGSPSPNIDPAPNQQDVLDAYTSVYLPETFGTPEGELKDGENARAALARLARDVYKNRLGLDVTDMPVTELLDGTEYMVFPHFLVWPSLANPLGYRFRPGATPDSCTWETFIFMPFHGERPPSGPVIHLQPGQKLSDISELGYVGPILQQDAENLEFMQNGMKASASGLLQISRYQESRIRHYHDVLESYLSK